ncbi:tol-pal system protein YbgF [Jannaschia sp. W003]|uniref:tol-pal system protein YbgF n=1 Tax=Jannaschia sp. W003 TaxID=2867012 RepID=UPI0021A67E5B|nr:tol-pal system protein YbgF [Jannaschia sp. W003]UWQ22526.1 tol-pal system protein YbgF [Jannaschia sp. W003]
MIRAALLLALLAAPAAAQDADTLADIRQQLQVLNGELQGLKRELSTTGAPALGIAGTTFPDRVIALESQLQDLSGKTERLAFRVESVAKDGGNRIEDLRFQLCELTPDCDIGALPAPSALGGETGAPAGALVVEAPAAAAPAAGTPELAVDERSRFDAARIALSEGRHDEAARLFGGFVESYPTGPLTAEAHLLRGEALAETGDAANAARAYLESFSGTPDGPHAAAALLGLGRALGSLGQTGEACLTLEEVAIRFPSSPETAEARMARTALACG